ncbi:MAG TPA: sporadic carbohydrate cluster 2OG-Fe(II) oxygenase [Verrucomicrobiae bacterium]|nr:sporadic carbohydrate cluster 2OG-Fe(II) oxygenase [Verrucomicrobiae bacterium]
MTFLERGYVIAPADDPVALVRIRELVATTAAAALGDPAPADAGAYLDDAGSRIDPARVNDVRLHVIAAIEREPWFRASYYACGRKLVDEIVGNELAIQRSVGFSIQLPGDASSVLPLHSDAWSEDSPFEAVLWIPLVDCYRTKSMFILPRERDVRWRDRVHEFERGGVEALFQAVENDVEYLDVPFGSVLLFTHTLMHGNRVNRETTARWSLNVRFKGLFTPYADKRLGDFFEPLSIRPLTRIGLDHRYPAGFHE